MEKTIREVVGPSGLMEFIRFDHGEILWKEPGKSRPRILRLVVDNPLIMKQMVEHMPDPGSYAPVTILMDERSDAVHLSYDTTGSILAPYGSSIASNIAKNLDEKIKALLEATAKWTLGPSDVTFRSSGACKQSKRTIVGQLAMAGVADSEFPLAQPFGWFDQLSAWLVRKLACAELTKTPHGHDLPRSA
jgi:uncharacterized protein (DUF302 family)